MDGEPVGFSAVEFPDTFFRREDESDDPLFYREPRLVVHIDEATIEAVSEYLGETLPPRGVVLDLMSSWRTHLPATWPRGHVTGLGMNGMELAENPQLDERIVHDLNADPVLPLATERFDAAVVTVSIQYMTRPVEVFAEVRRVLKPGGQIVYGVPIERPLMAFLFRVLGYNIRGHHFSTERDVSRAADEVVHCVRRVALRTVIGAVYEVGHYVVPS